MEPAYLPSFFHSSSLASFLSPSLSSFLPPSLPSFYPFFLFLPSFKWLFTRLFPHSRCLSPFPLQCALNLKSTSTSLFFCLSWLSQKQLYLMLVLSQLAFPLGAHDLATAWKPLQVATSLVDCWLRTVMCPELIFSTVPRIQATGPNSFFLHMQPDNCMLIFEPLHLHEVDKYSVNTDCLGACA